MTATTISNSHSQAGTGLDGDTYGSLLKLSLRELENTTQAMDILLSAVASDLTGRLVSFLIGKYWEPGATDGAVRLRRALLRACAVVEEAEGRQIANRTMLLQLRQLRRELCRGAYVLDDLVDPSCRSNGTASGIRPLLKRATPGTAGSADDGIGVAVESLEAALSDAREFVVLLGACPHVTRQPYSAYLFMEVCMFGRQMEKEQIIGFLLQPAQDLAVLPIIGPHDVGKRTLVEHVCLDERVQGHFTEIHRLSSSDDLDLLLTSRRDNEQHHSLLMDATTRSLFVIDLADEEAWRRFHSSMRHRGNGGSKIIIISRTERHSILGTVPPLRLLAPRREELWYLFKGLAFGGADPEERPELVRIAMALFKGFLLDLSPFTTVHNLGVSLRADMSARSWRRVLNVSAAATMLQPWERDRPQGNLEFYFHCRPVKDAAGTPLLFYDRRKSTGLGRDDLPKVTMLELVTGGAAVPVDETRFDVLVWRSRIPPYASYVVACDAERARQVVAGQVRVHKRKRGQQDDMSKSKPRFS